MPALGEFAELATWQGEESGAWTRLHGAWERTAGGVRVLEPTKLLYFFAEQPLTDWEVRFTGVTGDGMLYVELDEYAFDIGGPDAPASRIYQSWGGTCVLAATGRCPRATPGAHDIVCRRSQERVELWIDSVCLLTAADPAPGEASIHLTAYLPNGARLTGLHLGGVPAPRPVQQPRPAPFALDVCVDFLDDMVQSAWTPATLDAAMAFHARHGVRRLHFIYTGGYRGGFYDRRGMTRQHPGLQTRIDRTYAQIGEYMPAFFKAAHAHGMQTVAVFKPFEMAMGYTVPYGSDEARRWGKIPSLGGMLWQAINFTAEHPHLRMERDLRDVPADLDRRRIGRVALTAEAGLPARLDPGRLELWVSRDNGRYTRLDGSAKRVAAPNGAQRIVFDHLDTDARFAAVICTGTERQTFGNRLTDLLEVTDTEGRRLPVTLAFSKGRGGRTDFRQDGFDMDSAGATCPENFHWLDGGHPLAFGLGYDRYISGALCAAYPEVQDEWLAQVDACIAAGADAVDFRLHHHNRALDWGAYSFNEPVVRAFRERYGVDIRTDPFDREALRCLQGEFYTAFLRRARARLRAAGVAMHAHLEMRMYPPRWPTYMEIRFPWRQWVDEGLVDEITLKSFRTLRSGVPLKAMERLRRDTGVKVNACPYLNDLVNKPNGRELLDFFIRDARATGVDGLTLYENAAIMAGKPEGGIEITHPWVMEMLTERRV